MTSQSTETKNMAAGRLTGVATIVGGTALALVSFLRWGSGETSSGTASVPGVGRPSLTALGVELAPPDSPNPGKWALTIGVLAIIAGAALAWSAWRVPAALAIALLGVVGTVVCLLQMSHVAGFVEPIIGRGSQSAGAGLLLATFLSAVLAVNGVLAFLRQRR